MAASRSQPGIAAFLDLKDSTFVWYQNADAAEGVIQDLRRVVAEAMGSWGGTVGNFTGDGFLLLFEDAERAIRCLAEVIERWEPDRVAVHARFSEQGTPLLNALSLMLRSGVAHGSFRRLSGWDQPQFAGEAINRASRCETASKKLFATLPLGVQALEPQQRVFVTEDVFNLIENKTAFHCSEQQSDRFSGYEGSQLRAVWPRQKRPPEEVETRDRALLALRVDGAARAGIGDRLVEASLAAGWRQLRLADELRSAASGTIGHASKQVLERAVAAYGEALKIYTLEASPADYAATQNSLGTALTDQAGLLAGAERAQRLEEAVAAFRKALTVRTLQVSPADYAATQNNLGNAFRGQAELLTGAKRAQRLEEAVAAFRKALKVRTLQASPADYAATQNNLGNAFGDQAELLAGAKRAQRLEEAVAAYAEALRVYTREASPAQYAATQNNLGIVLADQAELLAGAERAQRLEEAMAAYAEALKVYTRETSPAQYAATQNNLGTALADQAQLLAGAKRALRLKQAVAAYGEALKVRTLEASPAQYAATQNNLGNALRDQAEVLAGARRAQRLKRAVAAFHEALKVYAPEASPADYARVTENLAKTERLLKRGASRGTGVIRLRRRR